jgi:hypothetical protein
LSSKRSCHIWVGHIRRRWRYGEGKFFLIGFSQVRSLRTILTLWLACSYRYKKYHPGVSLCGLCTLKHFAKLVIQAAGGRREGDRWHYMWLFVIFTLGWEQDIGTCIPEHVRRLVTYVNVIFYGYHSLVR